MKVVILGLGQYEHGSGIAAALYYARRGDEVVVTDLKKPALLGQNPKKLKAFKHVRLVLGRHDLDDIREADLVVRNPGIPERAEPLKLAKKLGKPIVSDVSIFLEQCPAKVIGITGTRGKSTTASLLADILRASKKWKHVWLGGNILMSPLLFLEQVGKQDIVVLELSSWQLESLGERGVSPKIALWTNLMRDHLNTYGSMEEYAEAKAQIFRHQGPRDKVFLPANAAFNGYAKEAASRVYRWGKKGSEEIKIVDASDMRLKGEHNRMNAISAVSVARMLKVTKFVILRVLKTFKGVPNRQEILGKKHGVLIVNDTTSTTPDAAIAAIKRFSMEGELYMIFGGADKELVFDDVAKELKNHKVHIALLPGTAHAAIVKQFTKSGVDYFDVRNLKEAVSRLMRQAKKGDVLLLSPGAASFGLFKNEFDRGEQFRALVAKL